VLAAAVPLSIAFAEIPGNRDFNRALKNARSMRRAFEADAAGLSAKSASAGVNKYRVLAA
jgi:hypothetical protein